MTLTAAVLVLAALAAAPVHLGAAADARSVALVFFASARGRLTELVERRRPRRRGAASPAR